MANIRDIRIASSYQGDSALGGGSYGVADINTQPVQALAQYTFMYNRIEDEKRTKDVEQWALELADLTQFDPNQAVGKDKDQVLDAYKKLWDRGQQMARKLPKNNDERIANRLEYRKDVDGLKKLMTTAKARYISYMNEQNEIASDPNMTAQAKELAMADLEQRVQSTATNELFPSRQKFGAAIPKIGDPVSSTVEALQDDGNKIFTVKYNLFSPKANLNQAFVEEQGMSEMFADENSPAFQQLSDLQKKEIRFARANNRGFETWRKSAEVFNAAINSAEYRNEDGSLNLDAIKSRNPIISNITSLGQRWNQYAAKMKNQVEKGYFTDSTGKTVKLSTLINKDDYFSIDLTKPVSASTLIFLERFAKASPDTRTTQITETDDANQRAQVAAQERMNRDDNRTTLAAAAMRGTGGSRGGVGEVAQDETYSGNALDEIGGSERIEFADGRYIQDGVFYNKQGSPTGGTATVRTTDLSANIANALKAAGYEFDAEDLYATFNKNGEIVHLQAKDGIKITREAMVNAQKKFDTERKGSEPLRFGKRVNAANKGLQKIATPAKTTPSLSFDWK